MEVCYSACFSYLPGNYSEPILAPTNAISEKVYAAVSLKVYAAVSLKVYAAVSMKVYAAVSLTFRKSCLTLEIITLSIMG